MNRSAVALYADVYGTLLVDAATRLPIELWAGRFAEQSAAWPRAPPGVEVVCRPTTTRPGCTSTRTSSPPWRKPPPRRRRPGQRGRPRRTKRAGDRKRSAREERRRVRRRRRLRLKAALLGRSRGGQTSKVHLAADRKCRPLAFILTAGQAADSPQFIPVLKKVRVRGPVGRPRTRPDAVAGDKAYSPRGNRAYLRKRRIKAAFRRRGTRPPTGRRRAVEAVDPSVTTPSFTRNGTPSSGRSTR